MSDRTTIRPGNGKVTAVGDLDDEHVEFKKVCRSFVDNHVSPLVRQAEENRSVPPELWLAMGRAGLLGLTIPEEHGGNPGDSLAVAILAEELARASSGIAITPLVSSYMAAPHIASYGTDEQRSTYLPGLASGAQLAAIAVTESGAGSDVAAITTRAIPLGSHDDGWSISGSKTFITNAGLSDVMVVAARVAEDTGHRGISTFLVPTDTAGLTLGPPFRKLGWRSSDTREVFFDRVEVPATALLGKEGRGFYQIMERFQLERIVLAAMGVGLAGACLEESYAHLTGRRAFGGALIDKQTVRHRLASMAVDLDAARALTYLAAERHQCSHPEAARSVAVAKFYAAQAANRVADDAVQLFGGSGFMDETVVTRHFRDARILRIGGGTDEIQLEILAGRRAGAD
ncbi:MAG TPA: acyl-CoA dehydrogenase family protein [Acidimicrobiales bacterium]|jgi:acyl-CoA dehydrogenase/citronellyl-CoA dehydrogenase|nr:acyl-CoA dehydrogenase family protein [Acidimicrobiales bacterium]